MAGGTWITQNKVRPGAYLNFKSVPRPTMTIGDRGIATIGVDLDWGDESKLISLYSDELLTGAALSKVGLTAFDEQAKLLVAILSNCYMCQVFRMNYGGTKAVAQIGDLNIEAKYPGAFGNRITVAVEVSGVLFAVDTFVDGNPVDRQTVATIAELQANNYVIFASEAKDAETLTPNAGTPLTTGTNGATTETEAYVKYMSLLKYARWNTWAVSTSNLEIKKNAAQFIELMRNDEGRYVQAVIAKFNEFDFEGVITNLNSCSIYNVPFTAEEMTSVIAGFSAGCPINESLTATVIRGGTDINPILSNSEIIEATLQGFMTLSANQDSSVVIESDINSLRSFTAEKNSEFRKNRIIRTLDEIGTSSVNIWEQKYKGKVNNNNTGRAMFRTDLIFYLNQLQVEGAIQEFNGAEDVEVTRGLELDAVVCNIFVMPVDSMEKLFMTVHVRV